MQDKANDGLFHENGSLSLTRVLSFLYFLFFVVITSYLVVMQQTWGSYDIFAAIIGGGGVAGQVSNKFINSKYNTAPGSFDCAAKQKGV